MAYDLSIKQQVLAKGKLDKDDILPQRCSVDDQLHRSFISFIFGCWPVSDSSEYCKLPLAKSWEQGNENRDHLFLYIILTGNVVKKLECIGHYGVYLHTVPHWVHIIALQSKDASFCDEVTVSQKVTYSRSHFY